MGPLSPSNQPEKSGLSPILLIVGVFFLALLALALLAAFFFGDSTDSFSSESRVAVIPIVGEIYSRTESFSYSFSSRELADYLEKADADPSIDAILLDIDSPGGSVVASKEIAYAIANTRKPVVAYIGSIGASGGYYAASAADYIVADEDAITGSIGVIAIIPSVEQFLEEHGINVQVLKKGRYKAAGNLFEDLTPDEKAIYQTILDQAYAHFKRDILQFRPALSEEKLDAVADGRILTGEQALASGLIDQTGSFDDALMRAGELAGNGDATAVEYAVKSYSLLDFFTKAGFSLGNGFQKGLAANLETNAPAIRS